ncbi:MAG TPA: response regulator [Nitrososphaeraceae archaeon]|jgi:DNA-binding response OmpR family regulator|nr:response regulator [Nitrososphaeraceae archaeon]
MALIVIADEDRLVVNHLYALFKLSGYEVNMAFSAKECLELLDRPAPNNMDVVLIDGKIAEDRGAMVISRIKQSNPDTKVLVVAYTDSPRNLILEYGADDFVIKPVSGETIVNKANALVQTRLSDKVEGQ